FVVTVIVNRHPRHAGQRLARARDVRPAADQGVVLRLDAVAPAAVVEAVPGRQRMPSSFRSFVSVFVFI
ncbi:hypothetical protein, partial [Isoptericola croceus]|uniref:hypothetical protein n=1 Tax=Isoptericola croceus TaxID=3031406 RepID=UPI0023F80261